MKPVNGVVYYKSRSDQLKYEYNYKEGKLDGLCKTWYDDGQLKYEHNYKNGKWDGLRRGWYENGQLHYEKNFKAGKFYGLHKDWYKNGKLKSEYNYIGGKYGISDGLQRGWYENGQLHYEKNTKAGKLNGLYKSWYDNGQLEDEINYTDGKLNGLYKTWHENGQLKYERNYRDGNKIGIYKIWVENGQLVDYYNYKDDKLDGLARKWYDNGQLMFEGIYKYGIKDGLYKAWYENGQLKREINYRDDKLIYKKCWDVKGNQIECDQANISGSKFYDNRDGKEYKTVKIGNQTWMAENLAYKPSSGNYWAYDNDNLNVVKYGYLYDWETANNVCPAGWHLPSQKEWDVLINYLGGENEKSFLKLKSPYVQENNNNGTNESGFNGLLGGTVYPYHKIYRPNDEFKGIGSEGYFWCSGYDMNPFQERLGQVFSISTSYKSYSGFHADIFGNSVRCIKD